MLALFMYMIGGGLLLGGALSIFTLTAKYAGTGWTPYAADGISLGIFILGFILIVAALFIEERKRKSVVAEERSKKC